jgi:pimeloyl-ACP methyl ester carboxylesterase
MAILMMRSLLVFGVLSIALASYAEQRLISAGGRALSIDCDGALGKSPTVVLMAGGGRTAKDWAKVQPAVAGFTRVCSYDRAGLGDSDKSPKVQSVEEIVNDLHAVLHAAHEMGPYILVAHSIAGIYARGFETRFPEETAGLVMLDSSHEEQAMRQQELFKPSLPAPAQLVALQGFFARPDQRLDWRTDLPLIVISHGKVAGDTQALAWERIWKELQQDLANRSPRGQLRVAGDSGHFIQLDQPDMVIQAIRDVKETR